MTYDEFSEIVIEGYLRTYNIRETMKETGDPSMKSERW